MAFHGIFGSCVLRPPQKDYFFAVPWRGRFGRILTMQLEPPKKLHGIKRQKVPKMHGLKNHQKNHSLACKKTSRFWNTKRTLM